MHPRPSENLSRFISQLNSLDFIAFQHRFTPAKRIGANNLITFAAAMLPKDAKSIGLSTFGFVISTIKLDLPQKITKEQKKTLTDEVIAESNQAETLLKERRVNLAFIHTPILNNGKGKKLALLAPMGDLKTYLNTLKQKLPHEKIKQLVAQIVLSIFHLHSKNLVHRDIKPENILVFLSPTKEVHLKLADINTVADKDDPTLVRVGTPPFLAPEVSTADDVKAEDLLRKSEKELTTTDKNLIEKYRKDQIILNKKYRTADKSAIDCYALGAVLLSLTDAASNEISLPLNEMINKLINKDPTKRINIVQVINHPYFGLTEESRLAFFARITNAFPKRDENSIFSLLAPPIQEMILALRKICNALQANEIKPQDHREITETIAALQKKIELYKNELDTDDPEDKHRNEIMEKLNAALTEARAFSPTSRMVTFAPSGSKVAALVSKLFTEQAPKSQPAASRTEPKAASGLRPGSRPSLATN